MVTKILTIKSIGLTKLNNAEYLNLMTRLDEEILKAEVTNIGLTPEEAQRFKEYVISFSDVFIQSKANTDTGLLKNIDGSRDKTWQHILVSIQNAAKSPITVEQQASKILSPCIKPYLNKTNIANEQETQLIRAFLVDMEKPQNKEQLIVLNLQAAISELGRSNEEYAQLSGKRALDQLDKLPNSKTLRKNLDEQYNYITQKAYAVNMTTPNEKSTAFITNMNIFIDEVNAAYNRRVAHGEKKAEGDTAVEE